MALQTTDLAGDDALENAALSAIVEVCEDLWIRIHSIHWLTDDAMKSKAKAVLKENYLPLTIAKLEAQCAKNSSNGGWMYGNKVR